MDSNTRKLYEMKAEILQALAHPTRLAIIDLLVEGERCVCDIAQQVGSEFGMLITLANQLDGMRVWLGNFALWLLTGAALHRQAKETRL